MSVIFSRDFDRGGDLNDGVGPDIAFTRVDGAAAFYSGSWRFQPMNLFRHSSEHKTGWSTVDGIVIQSQDITPRGHVANLFLAGTGGASHRLRQTITYLPNTMYRWSAIVKAHGAPKVLMEASVQSGFPSAVFDLRSGNIDSQTGLDAEIEDLGDDYYRISNLYNTSSGAGTNIPALYSVNTAGSTNWTGTGSIGFFVSESQITRGYSQLPYNETDTTTGPMGPRVGVSWPDANGIQVNRGLAIEAAGFNEFTTNNMRHDDWSTIRVEKSDQVSNGMQGITLTDTPSADDTHRASDAIFLNSGQQYTFSAFVKNPVIPATTPFFLFNTDAIAAQPKTYINVESITIGTMGHDAASVVDWGDNLRRVWVVYTATSSGNKTHDMMMALVDNDNAFVGDGTHDIEFYHPQVDKGSFPRMPSGSGKINGETAVASIAAGASHTMMVEGFTGFGAGVLMSWDDGTENNRWRIERTADTKILFSASVGGAIVASLTAVASIPNHTAFRVAVTGHTADYHISLDGATAVSEGGGGMPVVDELRFGDSPTGSEEWNSMIGKVYVFTGSSTVAELETLAAQGVAAGEAAGRIQIGMGIGL